MMKKVLFAFAICAIVGLCGCEEKHDPAKDNDPVTSVELDHSAIVLSVGETAKLTATVQPENASNKALGWTSSNDGIATVDKNGLVTAVAVGKVTITVTAGEMSASCRITVKEALPAVVDVTGISISDIDITLEYGQTRALTATLTPANATDKTVIWSSSDNTIASVDSDGLVTALGSGTATITATAGLCEATCTVRVPEVLVTAINPSLPVMRIEFGVTSRNNFDITPANAADKNVRCYSKNERIATVKYQESIFQEEVTARWCEVTGVGVGVTDIVIENQKSGVTAEFTVMVVAPAPEWRDLGLSVKWADRNLGAVEDNEVGTYYAWGELESKDSYYWANYKWYAGSVLTKYKTTSASLYQEDDAAFCELGGKSRIPTAAEIKELLDTFGSEDFMWDWCDNGQYHGWCIESLITHDSIFIPVSGFMNGSIPGAKDVCAFWSREISSSSADDAIGANMTSRNISANYKYSRAYGLPIRAVQDK